MDSKKEFRRSLSAARSIAFDLMAALDRLEAEMDKDSATWADVGTMNDIIKMLASAGGAISGYVNAALD